MDWQSILVILVAAGCAGWLMRQFLRPFLVKGRGLNEGCGGAVSGPHPGQLLEVLPPDE